MDTLKNVADSIFKIHGDNIVECERTLSLIIDALNSTTVNVDGPFGSAVCPSFHLELASSITSMTFTFLPGFGRWSQDILALVRDRGRPIREATDAILTRVTTSTSEEPIRPFPNMHISSQCSMILTETSGSIGESRC